MNKNKIFYINLVMNLLLFPAGIYSENKKNSGEINDTNSGSFNLIEENKDRSIGKSPLKAAFFGIIPGAGQFYLGNYASSASQFVLFSSSAALADHFHRKNDFIPYRKRTVEYSFSDAVYANELRKRNLVYNDDPLNLISESKFERDMRLLRDGRIAETNPLIEFGNYRRLNYSTLNYDLLAGTAFHTMSYSIYSSYRDAGGISGRSDETFAELSSSPFMLSNLLDHKVMIPAIVFGLITAGGVKQKQIPVTLVSPGMKSSGHLAGTFSMALMQTAVGEESLFRGFINHSLSHRMGPVSGAIASSAIFAAAHYLPEPDQSPGSLLLRFGTGLYFSWLQYKEGWSIKKSIAAHFWQNFFAFAVIMTNTYKENRNVSKSQREVHFMPVTYTMKF